MAIPCSHSKSDMIVNYNDYKFMKRNWFWISREEAMKINPYLENSPAKYFYQCKLLNKKTKKCKAYSSRPYTCSGYPWYGKGEGSNKLINQNCGYIKKGK